MSRIIKCFYIEPTDMVALYLRRYRSQTDEKCPGAYGYHNASVRIEDQKAIVDDKGFLYERTDMPPFDDPRWPERCECGYVFGLDDQWQLGQDTIYNNGIPLRDQQPGAIYNAFWLHPPRVNQRDGRALTVVLPGGYTWNIDGPSTNGNGWTRTGEPPMLTVKPSIVVPGFHAHLTNGELIEC